MTHSDAGRYAAKHQNGKLDEGIVAAVRANLAAGELACVAAERIAAELGVTMAEVGRTADLLEIRIGRCQLGLFGYDAPGGRTVQPAAAVEAGLEAAIRAGLADGRLSCATAWKIAGDRKLPRMEVCSACEKLKIKVKPCQLGAF
ncbi:MAG: hypothetical protein ACYC7J_03025 [Syntrophales bacterium]